VRRLAERAKIDRVAQGTGASKAVLLKTLSSRFTNRSRSGGKALTNDAGGDRANVSRQATSFRKGRQIVSTDYAPEAWDDTINWARVKVTISRSFKSRSDHSERAEDITTGLE
jgi:hypothetical protein